MTILRASPKRALAGFAAFAMIALAGCQTAGGGMDDAPVFESGTPVPEAAPLPPPPPPQPAAKNKVALLVPMSGANARVGRSLSNTANMALLDLGGGDIELQTYDTAANGVEAAAQRAAADGAKLFLGPLTADNVRAVRDFARARSIPVISFSNDEAVAGGNVYIMGFKPDQSIRRAVQFARARGIQRFAALVPSGLYGRRASDAFLSAVRDSGGQVTAIETFERSRDKLAPAVRRLTDYDSRIARAGGGVRRDGTVARVEERLAPVSFQALLIADGGAIASEFLPSLQKYGAGPGTVRFLGTELWNADGRISQARGLHGAWFASVPDARFNQLAQRYRQKFGGAPSRLSSLAYDAVLLAQGASGEWRVGEPFPVRKLTDPDGFVGVDGIFRFGADGIAQRGLEVQQVGPSGTRIVDAAPTSFQRSRVGMLTN